MNENKRIEELALLLNQASLAYYQEGREIMPNIEYDALYDELLKLEEETGIILPDSPTQNVGSKLISALPRERHQTPMLSLNKTKSVEDLQDWLGDREGILSWKMDGLTVVLTYKNGKLFKAVTRGNGEIGEVITANARTFVNVPQTIPYQGELILRGEAIITYPEFERINAEIPEADAKYKNPRNLCSGSVRQLDPEVTRKRHVHCVLFALVRFQETQEVSSADLATFSARFEWLRQLGFETVEYALVTKDTLPAAIETFKSKIVTNAFPSDGLVLSYNDVAYGESLGRTAKFPRSGIAFKWQDEKAETVLRRVEWSPSRTGLINPVAVFDSVELEGTTVTRASVHNLSIIEQLKLGIGDHILVYKSNMIIPQICENLTGSGGLPIPEVCPVCGGKTEVHQENESKTLYCENPVCPAKKMKSFALAVSRDALNIEGLSEKTLERFIAAGFLKELKDLFDLDKHRREIAAMEGFGEKSAENLITALNKAKDTRLYRFVYALGIPGIGLAIAKLLCKAFGQSYEALTQATVEQLSQIESIGGVLADNIVSYFQDPAKKAEADALYQVLSVEEQQKDGGSAVSEETQVQKLSGLGFVITGDVVHFANRKELQELIESCGGKVLSSVSAKTSYLINNDSTSQSSKNKKAKELSIPILTEEEFLQKWNLQGTR